MCKFRHPSDQLPISVKYGNKLGYNECYCIIIRQTKHLENNFGI